MGYFGAGGKLTHGKNQKQKISWHCPFNADHRDPRSLQFITFQFIRCTLSFKLPEFSLELKKTELQKEKLRLIWTIKEFVSKKFPWS